MLPNFDSGIRILPPATNMASDFYERLEEHIHDNQTTLPLDKMLVVTHYVANSNLKIYVTGIGYHNPSLMILYGYDANKTEYDILLHFEHVQLIIEKVKIESTPTERRTLGFLGEISK
jgi:hypothetical protein